MKRTVTILIVFCLGFTLFAGDNLKVSGQFRYRYHLSASDFDSETDANTFSVMRTRLNVAINPADDVQAFVQYQDSRTTGTETNTLTDGTADAFDLHQGYVKVDNLFALPVDLKLGRYEVALGPQRLVGSVGWHNIGRSFDGVTFTYHNPLFDVDLFSFKTFEDADDELDVFVRGAYANMKLENYKAQAFFILDDERSTYGVYAKGEIFPGLTHETEFAMQSGTVEDVDPSIGDVDQAGMLYAFNFTYDMNGILLSAGYDHVSGNDTDTEENEAFSTLYATNHKYYGYMDYFLNIPAHTNKLGLNDIHFRVSKLKFAGIAAQLDFHLFSSEFENDNGDTDFGSEFDVTLVKKYNDNVKFVAGYSIFTPGNLKAEDGDNGSGGYLMTLVNF